MKQQKTIAIDIDDVLSHSAEGFVAFSNERWGMQLSPDDYHEEWEVVWGVSLEEALQRSIEFITSGAFGEFLPREAALPVLKRLAKHYKLVVLTSRRSILKPETDQWIERHFPGIFSEVHYAGIWDRDLTHETVSQAITHTKAELCRELGADYLIDDQPKHCVGAAEAGIKSILFGDYKWSRDLKVLPAHVVRAHHWDEVAEYFHV